MSWKRAPTALDTCASAATAIVRSSPRKSAAPREARWTRTATVLAFVSTAWIFPTQVKWCDGSHQGCVMGQASAGAQKTRTAAATSAAMTSFFMGSSLIRYRGSALLWEERLAEPRP